MSLGTYSELKIAVANWLARDDLTGVIPDFITLAHSRINRDIRTLDMQTTSDLTINSQRVTVPSDLSETVRLYIDSSSKQLVSYVTPDYLFSRVGASESGLPTMFTREGSEFVFAPIPDSSYTGKLLYYADIPELTDLSQTNWLLTKYPDVYLYASLLEAKAYIMDDARITIWSTAYEAAIRAVNKKSKKDEFSGSPLQMRAG